MDDAKVEKWTLEDGRRAEKRITDLDGERVIELHVETERPLQLKQRIIEKSKPIVFERKIETLDASGNVVEQKVESIEPKVPMQVVEHIVTDNNQVVAQSVPQDCTVTRQEMIDTIAFAIKAAQLNNAAIATPAQQNELHSLGLADEIGVRLKSQGTPLKEKIYMGVSGILMAALIYYIVFAGH